MANSVMETGGSSVEALWNNFVRLGRDGMTTLVVPWLAIALIDFVFVGVSVLIIVATGGAEAGRGGLGMIQFIGFVQAVAVMTLRVALLHTLRDVAFRGPAAVRDFGAVAQDLARRLVPAFAITIVVGAVVTVGMMLCVLPGLVALFFLAFAPYLVVGKRMAIGEALAESVRWASSEWPVLLSALVVAFFATGILACVVGLISGFGAAPVLAMPAGLVGGWVVNTILGYVAFLWWGAAYVTAESNRQVDSLRQTAGSDRDRRPVPPAASPSVYEIDDLRPGQGSSFSDSDDGGS